MSFFDKVNGQLMLNSLGAQQVTSTLYTISPIVSQQKFYTLPPADFMPLVTGVGAFDLQIGHWRTFAKSGGFEEGLQQNGANKARLESVDATMDLVPQDILTWAKQFNYSVVELEQAMKANGMFSLIEQRLRTLKKEWDLGIQKAMFLGIASYKGLLNQTTVTNNTTRITKRLSQMTAAELNAFVATVYEDYRAACSRTAEPAMFIIPEGDYNGLAAYMDPEFTLRTKLEVVEQAFRLLTQNPGFQVKKCAYCDRANLDGGTTDRYVLHSNDPETLVAHVPLAFTPCAANSTNGFTWEAATYGQFSPLVVLRTAEVLYFSNTAALS